MGVFKWWRRERIIMTSRQSLSPMQNTMGNPNDEIGTIRTEKYKRDLAEFQARRLSGNRELPESPEKIKNGIFAPCGACTNREEDKSFNHANKSAAKYRKKIKRTSDHENVPNVKFLFQNQVFMPGDMFASYSEPYKTKRYYKNQDCQSKKLDFDQVDSPPSFFKNNSLPYEGNNLDFEEKAISSDSGRDDSGLKMQEVISELHNLDKWADSQLNNISADYCRVDDTKSEVSSNGLPFVSSSDLDVTFDRDKTWNYGKWGTVPVQVKKMPGLTVDSLKKSAHVEISVLRKCRHPNIILLMGVYPDIHGNVNIVCERCVDTLYGIVHVQGRIFSLQTSVQYASDIANALVFLRMRGFIHSELTSHSVMITARDTAKLSDCKPCVKLPARKDEYKFREINHYVNIDESSNMDCQPLLSTHTSDVYLSSSVAKAHSLYSQSDKYRWHAPETFQPNECGLVYVCPKSDVYSLCVVLWEISNAIMPFKNMTYDLIRELYLDRRAGLELPSDGTYPGCLLDLMQNGLKLERNSRPDLAAFAEKLRIVKDKILQMEYIVIPSRINRRISNTAQTESRTIQSDIASRIPEISDSDSDCPTYETIRKEPSDDDLRYKIPENYSTCSTPIKKVRARLTEVPQKSSPEYYSPSPEFRTPYSVTKLSKSFLPKSYTPLQINVPNVDCESLKVLPRCDEIDRPGYMFEVNDYSIPATPIARSNKLRKNAWLAGDDADKRYGAQSLPDYNKTYNDVTPSISSIEKNCSPVESTSSRRFADEEISPEIDCIRDSFSAKRLNRPLESHTWSYKTVEPQTKEEVLTNVNVKPLVAIHEKWIYEANKKTCKATCMVEENRNQAPAFKPASHCVNGIDTSVPNVSKKTNKYASHTFQGRYGGPSPEFCQARNNIAQCLTVNSRDVNPIFARKKDIFNRTPSSCTNTETTNTTESQPETKPIEKVDQTTDTNSIDEFMKTIIRKELYSILNEISDKDTFIEGEKKTRIKINGNSKPLLQITLSKNGDNTVQVMDSCVNVKVGSLKGDDSFDEQMLKRCQALGVLQESRSTEDLYIDDDVTTQLQENFGGKVKLIPLHGSLHEVLCDRQDDCCLIRVKKENGCDTIYFKCDNSDTESRDAIDGCEDTVVYKRSISLIQEKIERVIPKKNKDKLRPKSEVFVGRITKETRLLSQSSPTLNVTPEINIDRMCCDSSSDECVHSDDDFELLEREIEQEVAGSSAARCLDKISEESLSNDERVDAH